MKTILATDGNENIRLLLEAEPSPEGYKAILASTGLVSAFLTKPLDLEISRT